MKPIPTPQRDRRNDPHPVEDHQFQSELRAWTLLVLGRNGTGRVTVEFDFTEWRCGWIKFGGSTTRRPGR